MELLILSVLLLAVFLLLRTNFKISEHDEGSKEKMSRVLAEQEKGERALQTRLEIIEKRIIAMEKSVQESVSTEKSKPAAAISQVKISELLSEIGSLKDILRDVKTENNNPGERAAGSENEKHSDHFSKDLEGNTGESVEQKESLEKNNGFRNQFDKRVQKLNSKERWLSRLIVEKKAEEWHPIADITQDDKNYIFVIPKLSRKLITDGIPVIKMKTVKDKLFVMWGESLRKEKQAVVSDILSNR